MFLIFADIITNGNHIGDANADQNRLGANLNRNTLIIHSVQRVSSYVSPFMCHSIFEQLYLNAFAFA